MLERIPADSPTSPRPAASNSSLTIRRAVLIMAPRIQERCRMNRRSITVLLAVLIALAGFALNVAVRAQAPAQLFGTWKLNPAKSKYSPGPAPKSMTVTYSPAGFGMKIVVDVLPA